ncbi:hypothetical protein RhiJN_03751 [Ceratobasidium sp. AG-Ba]|nr:hypothetical protein RhiJN_03751 [Ceratobasidium sp. AG-Ba]
MPSVDPNLDEEHLFLHILPTQPISECILSLGGLRELQAGVSIFSSNIIQEIGSLAHLERLTLRPERSEIELPEVSSLAEDAFRATTMLTCMYMSWTSVRSLLGYTPLTRNITSLRVSCPFEAPLGEWHGATASLRLKNMTQLRDLDIEFPGSLAGPYHLNVDEFLEVLSRLPLRTVRILGAQFKTLTSVPLDKIFPAVTDMILPQQKADLHRLTRFAIMPNIKHLAIAFSEWHGKNDWLSPSSVCCTSLETLELTLTRSYGEALPEIYPKAYIHTVAK